MSKYKGKGFPHLHLHDQFSDRDGIGSPEEYAKMAAEQNVGSLCITNHGSPSGWARQQFACKKEGIKPIFGVEAYMCEHRLRKVTEEISELKSRIKKSKDKDEVDSLTKELLSLQNFRNKEFRPSRHTILLAENLAGFKNLTKITTDAYKNGFYYKPRTDTSYLSQHSEGVIFSTACIGGYIPKMAEKSIEEAIQEAGRLQEIFGKDNFFVELMLINYDEQIKTNQRMLKVAKAINAPTIITADVHYPKCTDSFCHEILLLMRDKKTISQKREGAAWEFAVKDLYWKKLPELYDIWKNLHYKSFDKKVLAQSIFNTYELADRIENIEFDTSIKLPKIYEEPYKKLVREVQKGLSKRREAGQIPASGYSFSDYIDRVKFELRVIREKNFAEYFLIIQDIVNYAKKVNARIGPGRGSASGSCVSYALGIVNIDPIKFELLFERFIAIDRPDPPDIDLDFSPQHRDQIKQYIFDKYPTTATIGTYSVFGTKSSISDVSRVFDIDYRDTLQVTKQIDMEADKMEWDEIIESYPEVAEWAEKHPKAFQVAKRIRGMISHRGQHAAGVLVAPEESMDMLPLMRNRKSITTAYTDSAGFREISKLGYLKIDVLGVRNVNIVPRAIEAANKRHGVEIIQEDIPVDDKKTIKQFNEDITGVFQFDTTTTRPIIKEVKIDSFMDAAIITSLARPGPLEHGIHKEFAKRKREGDLWKNEVREELHEVLDRSKGLMIFQEDIMKTLQIVGGMSREVSNRIRKIIGKKRDAKEFEPYWDQFKKGGLKNGYSEDALKDIWDHMLTFANYGFNASHAVSYTRTAWEQVYMRAHYPLEYYYALLAETPRGKKTYYSSDVLIDYVQSAIANGIQVVGPNISLANNDFKIHDEKIYFGLSNIKDVGTAGLIVEKHGPVNDIYSFCKLVKANRSFNISKVKAMIFSGALDKIDCDFDNEEYNKEKYSGIFIRNYIYLRYLYHMSTIETRTANKKKFLNLYLEAHEKPFGELELIDMELNYLGMLFSIWDTEKFQKVRKTFNIPKIFEQKDDSSVEAFGFLNKVKTHKIKTGTMAFLSISDDTGMLTNITIWPQQYKYYRDVIKQGNIVGMILNRKKNQNPKYGKYSYYLDNKSKKPVMSFDMLLEKANKK